MGVAPAAHASGSHGVSLGFDGDGAAIADVARVGDVGDVGDVVDVVDVVDEALVDEGGASTWNWVPVSTVTCAPSVT